MAKQSWIRKQPLSNKVAVVCGGSKGIGKETAKEIVVLGGSVCIAARHLEPLEAAAREIEELKREDSQFVETIACDATEDKKHIDLSSEPLILVLAAGNSEAVLSDLAKDVAIFKAHRALPVVFCAEGDRRFDEYAAAVIELPACSPLLSMITVTMAGHLFGYHAARAIDEGARFLGRIRSVGILIEAQDLERLQAYAEGDPNSHASRMARLARGR